jgi:nickel-dependent lactate racemase
MDHLKTTKIYGFGTADSDLSLHDFAGILHESLANINKGSRVLVIVPDKTRDDNTHHLVPITAGILSGKQPSKFDILIAQGTHAPMTEREKLSKIGIESHDEIPILGNIFDHEWNNPDELISIGKLTAEMVREITNGLIGHPIDLTINNRISTDHYDHILVFGACAPHEVAGFAGGAKYFFPGVSGADLTNATHWLGALAGIENTIGRIETPSRNLMETAADRIKPNVICFTSVVTRSKQNKLRTHAFFGGDFRLSLRKAAEISRQVHIKYTGKKYKTVVALLDKHYDELWTGAKASYKLGGIIEEGGELIIYAPHLRCASDTHGVTIEKFGYAPIEKVKEMVAASGELQANLCVAAHLSHFAFAGSVASGGKLPRYNISLASQIDQETCRKLNLNYLDYREFDLGEYSSDPDILIVERAGLELYLVSKIQH